MEISGVLVRPVWCDSKCRVACISSILGKSSLCLKIPHHKEISMETADIGRLAEARFFQITTREQLAPWVHSITPASAQCDACGVDAVALVRRYITDDLVRVPIQIKTSFEGVEEHLAKHKHHWLARMVFVVVNQACKDKKILAQLHDGLHHVRAHRYDYHEFFYAVDTRDVSPEHRVFLTLEADKYLGPYVPQAGHRTTEGVWAR